MRKTNCKNGHFFDGDITSICPLCKEPEMTAEEKKGQNSFFSWFGQEKSGGKVEKNDNPTKGFSEMVDIPEEKKMQPPASQEKEVLPVAKDVENPYFGFESFENTKEEEKKSEQIEKQQEQELKVQQDPPKETVPTASQNNQGLASQLQMVRNTSSDATSIQKPAYKVNTVNNSEDPKTVGVYANENTAPVVGWLVCIKGSSIGESFEIYPGQNSIGRSINNDIMLSKEASVSREKHAFITFDPQNLDFYIQKGESTGLTYKEGALIMSYDKLEAYNKILLGNSEFIFVPFCGSQFKWSDYIN
ncbi:MAG: FHA domain-containing protein [Lachnospiraceae bacterium]|nr:FHA domain-containing protein [Lachnospiraceae bacterium]